MHRELRLFVEAGLSPWNTLLRPPPRDSARHEGGPRDVSTYQQPVMKTVPARCRANEYQREAS